ncbi:S66 family peptidase [Fimbriimonas ginsengisoli]|uniref:LD-carboxypeptidase n=1 Tax=Fimbriimonas ginsengisoli Gsoil 348 TaxID=661478 RepID=A0A068NVQ9_FIMGI|nr:S66 peptidase family protein [Fimbriimonas ginsengisoli]AIE86880.1 hypothetical protein OP10G_3512 [Fimbriimonas ginsengisoli Gsoil 348]
MLKPARLREGDAIAVLSPSWGGPSVFPHVFDLGLRNLESVFGLRIKEFPTARAADNLIYQNPKMRAEDLNRAFADPEVKGIVTSIGGDDSVRILPFLDLHTILANPKILMGFSDTTTLTSYLSWHGLVTFNGPSVMAGFAQLRHLPASFGEHIRQMLMVGPPALEYHPYDGWTNRYLPWETPGYAGETAPLEPNEGWRWLQGAELAQGRLFGGCIDVLEFLKGTRFWPPAEFWPGKILFFETSEEIQAVAPVKYMLRNYGSMGVFDKVEALLFGRARNYSPAQNEEYFETIVKVVAGEFGRHDLPIVANMDFGHTDPQWILPLGAMAELDCERRRFRLLESAVA